MRNLSTEFETHIGSGATNLATCWRMIRTDGEILGFTDHDVALIFDSTNFIPAHGLDGGETATKLGPQVDTSEIVGLLHADAVDEDDILLGRYDEAVVETWRVNWRDVSVRYLMRRDTIGEIIRVDGVFRMELRSAQYALNIAKGKIYQGLCNTRLGETPCGIDINLPAFRADTSISSVKDRNSVTVPLLSGFAEGWYGFGRASWTSGKRDGKADRIVAQGEVGGESVLTFAEPIIDWVAPGDTLTLFAGCDRRFATCQAKFSNIENFRGFPHIPGSDFVLRYPKSGGDFDGKPLFK